MRFRRSNAPTRTARAVTAITALITSMSSVGCGGTDLPVCGTGPLFSVLPIAESAVASSGPLGNLNPPSHTIPSDHAGLYVNAVGVPIVVPGDMHVKIVRRSTYVVSPFRQGQQDFAIYFDLCRDVDGQLGHLTTLRDDLASRIRASDCSSYSTADETIEACFTNVDVWLSAGDALGTVGGPTAMAFDLGTYDRRHENAFVNPSRVQDLTLHAVCPYELFPPTEAEFLLSRVGYGGDFRTVEPRCGTVEIDVADTAQGVWVRKDMQQRQSGDESAFVALAPETIHPDTTQMLSLGPPELGATGVLVPIVDSGRANRRFSDVGPTGDLYCYTMPFSTESHFVALAPDGTLTIERVTHTSTTSPCTQDPSTWAFTSAALTFVR